VKRAECNGAVFAESDYSVRVAGKENRDAAWYYPQPFDAARQIKGWVAFWKGGVVRDG